MKKESFCLAIFMLAFAFAVLSSCSKAHDHPFAPIDHEHPHEHDPVTIIVEVPVLCDTTDIEVAFTVIVDQSAPNVYLVKVAGFPDEAITITETASTPTEKTIVRTYSRFAGGAISLEKLSGSRAEAVKVEVTKQACSQ